MEGQAGCMTRSEYGRQRALVEVPCFPYITSTDVWVGIRTLVRPIVPRRVAICDLFLLVCEHPHAVVPDLTSPGINGVENILVVREFPSERREHLTDATPGLFLEVRELVV